MDILDDFAHILEGSRMSDPLDRKGDYTLFAPVNIDNDSDFDDMLASHVVGKRIMEDEMANLHSVENIKGNRLKFSFDGDVRVNGSKILHPDILCSNGVIHVIDKKLM
jgi:uncharacterized surface protein with fasciclin (FAS1) repeats